MAARNEAHIAAGLQPQHRLSEDDFFCRFDILPQNVSDTAVLIIPKREKNVNYQKMLSHSRKRKTFRLAAARRDFGQFDKTEKFFAAFFPDLRLVFFPNLS